LPPLYPYGESLKNEQQRYLHLAALAFPQFAARTTRDGAFRCFVSDQYSIFGHNFELALSPRDFSIGTICD
jgi:hypothetical protein